MQIVVPKFKAPVAKANKRTGKGDRHRPHRFVKGASIPVAAILILASALTIYLSFDKIFGSQAPDNYSLMEIIAARSWCSPPLQPPVSACILLLTSRCSYWLGALCVPLHTASSLQHDVPITS